jgi:hypothetical protein
MGDSLDLWTALRPFFFLFPDEITRCASRAILIRTPYLGKRVGIAFEMIRGGTSVIVFFVHCRVSFGPVAEFQNGKK